VAFFNKVVDYGRITRSNKEAHKTNKLNYIHQ
jgi:hypothetical protein